MLLTKQTTKVKRTWTNPCEKRGRKTREWWGRAHMRHTWRKLIVRIKENILLVRRCRFWPAPTVDIFFSHVRGVNENLWNLSLHFCFNLVDIEFAFVFAFVFVLPTFELIWTLPMRSRGCRHFYLFWDTHSAVRKKKILKKIMFSVYFVEHVMCRLTVNFILFNDLKKFKHIRFLFT